MRGGIALVQNCDRDNTRLGIIASLVYLGDRIGMKVVAEGVERRGELDALRATGLRFMQGFYFARPVFEGLASPQDVLAGVPPSGDQPRH